MLEAVFECVRESDCRGGEGRIAVFASWSGVCYFLNGPATVQRPTAHLSPNTSLALDGKIAIIGRALLLHQMRIQDTLWLFTKQSLANLKTSGDVASCPTITLHNSTFIKTARYKLHRHIAYSPISYVSIATIPYPTSYKAFAGSSNIHTSGICSH